VAHVVSLTLTIHFIFLAVTLLLTTLARLARIVAALTFKLIEVAVVPIAMAIGLLTIIAKIILVLLKFSVLLIVVFLEVLLLINLLNTYLLCVSCFFVVDAL